jgi:hypothetical protein
MPSQPCCRIFLWHQRNASERRTISSPSRISKSHHRSSSSLGWGFGYNVRVLERQCSFSEVVQQTIVTCDIHKAGKVGSWLEILLGFPNATGQFRCALHVTTIVLLDSVYVANRISSWHTVTQECYPVVTRGRARLRDRAYGT